MVYDQLDELKDRTKRVRVHSHTPLPREFAIPGTFHTIYRGSYNLTAIAHVAPSEIDAFRHSHPIEVDIDNLNLEDIFLELHTPEADHVSA